jgi:hypothetical protein
MAFNYIRAINIIPASLEWVYDTLPWEGKRPFAGAMFTPVNTYHEPGGTKTDFSFAIDQLQEDLPNCKSVSLVVQWLGDSQDLSQCDIYPSSTEVGIGDGTPPEFRMALGGTEEWRVSSFVLSTPGLRGISRPDGVNSQYGSTCSDASVVRAIQELKNRGFTVFLYLQINLDVTGTPWRGTIGFPLDRTAEAETVVANFLGSATPAMFTRDTDLMTVNYSGPILDFTYRRFVLHYANICVLAGGVGGFMIGSELWQIEKVRGTLWTKEGMVDGAGKAIFDYPFIEGLKAVCADVRSVFDAAGLFKNVALRQNTIGYSPDWTTFMGMQHEDTPGIWPHLDTLWASSNVDFVSSDNYNPATDWTTGDGGLDAKNWTLPAPTTWPVVDPLALGLGLNGTPTIYDLRYLKFHIEGGEKFHYFHSDYSSIKRFDPNGSNDIVQCPNTDRLAQDRQRFFPGQELYAFKNFRWWWNNEHRAIYDDGLGGGLLPHGPATQWVPRSKSIIFMEYGFPTYDRSTNEENLFYNLESVAGGVAFWARWNPGGLVPKEDRLIALQAYRAWDEYWTIDGKNEVSAAGVPMIAHDLMFAWTFDARPFPTFPNRLDVWSDGINYLPGHWIQGKVKLLPSVTPDTIVGSVPGATTGSGPFTGTPPPLPPPPVSRFDKDGKPTTAQVEYETKLDELLKNIGAHLG